MWYWVVVQSDVIHSVNAREKKKEKKKKKKSICKGAEGDFVRFGIETTACVLLDAGKLFHLPTEK